MSTTNKILLSIAAILSLKGAAEAQTVADTTKVADDKPAVVQTTDNFQGNLEAIGSLKNQGTSYLRPNIFYGMPADISGYAFMEIYNHGTIFGKNALSKNVWGPVSVMNQLVFGTGFPVQGALGLKVEGSVTDNTYANVYVLPAFVDATGKQVPKKAVIGGYAEVNLPLDVKVSGFAEQDVGTGTWNYGELNVEKMFGNVSLSYNPAFQVIGPNNSSFTTEHRVTAKYTFK